MLWKKDRIRELRGAGDVAGQQRQFIETKEQASPGRQS